MLHSIIANLRQHNWSIIVGEVLLLAIGLLAAFQVDRWWEQRAEKEEERIYIQQFIKDINADIPKTQNLRDIQLLRREYAELLLAVADEPEKALVRPGEFLAAIIGASYTNYPTLRSHTFDTLRSTGSMRLIADHQLTAAVYEYYEFDEHQTNFDTLFLSTEFRHWELAAGILSANQARWLQDNRVFALPGNIELLRGSEFDTADILATAQRLAANEALVSWLPQVREMQTYLITSLERQVSRGEDVLQMLEAYADEIGHPRGQVLD